MAELGIADQAGLNAVPRRTNLNRNMAPRASPTLTPTLLHGSSDPKAPSIRSAEKVEALLLVRHRYEPSEFLVPATSRPDVSSHGPGGQSAGHQLKSRSFRSEAPIDTRR